MLLSFCKFLLMNILPIHSILDTIKKELFSTSTLILQAPPGAGKSTVVPLALREEPWLKDQMIIMLEPRRIAARMVAERMAESLGECVGETVGYQIKMERRISHKTKILVVTEAILIRMLQEDSSLEGVGLIIFDEFHERSIHTDVSLALSLQVQEMLREDLKLLVMSATLDTAELTRLLGDVPVITSLGKSYAVDVRYLPIHTPPPTKQTMTSLLTQTVVKAFATHTGDILVFLAGVKEIKALAKSLHVSLEKEHVLICPLYSALTQDEQKKAIAKASTRKIILSTNIAQTSLTIEGVCVVVDSGLEKCSWYHYATGMDRLLDSFISKETATQRAGRAGRLCEGVCYRLWHEHKVLQASMTPEIVRVDLAPVLLELSLWGIEHFDDLVWLDSPHETALQEGWRLLQDLCMVDEKHRITPLGKASLALGVHPRLAYMILRANTLGFAYDGCLLAALLVSQDIFTIRDSDLQARFFALRDETFHEPFINAHRAKEVLKDARFYFQKLKNNQTVPSFTPCPSEMVGVLLLFAYPDRLARVRAKNDTRYKLSNGKGALLHHEETLLGEEFLVVPHVNANERDSFIHLASPISLNAIETYFSMHIKLRDEVTYNKESKRFTIKEKRCFFELELDSKPIQAREMSVLLLGLIRTEGLGILPWDTSSKQLRERIDFVNAHHFLYDVSDVYLMANLSTWLAPYLEGMKSVKELERLNMSMILLSCLSWEEQQHLERLAPKSVRVPSGSFIRIDYATPQVPSLHVKIQEIFGLHETPCVLDGKIPLQMHLLSPAMRPIQITYDLKSFWENSYEEVRKELRGKYKKHYWPQDPYEAIATNKTKKNMHQ